MGTVTSTQLAIVNFNNKYINCVSAETLTSVELIHMGLIVREHGHRTSDIDTNVEIQVGAQEVEDNVLDIFNSSKARFWLPPL